MMNFVITFLIRILISHGHFLLQGWMLRLAVRVMMFFMLMPETMLYWALVVMIFLENPNEEIYLYGLVMVITL